MRKKKKPEIVLLVVVFAAVGLFGVWRRHLVLNLLGDKEVQINTTTTYEESGVEAKACNIFSCKDLTDEVEITSNLDNDKAGEYEVTYTLDYQGKSTTVTRKVSVERDYAPIEAFESSLEDYIKDHNYDVSVLYYNIDEDYTYKYNGDTVYYGASLTKTLGALYAYREMTLTDSVRKTVESMITVSDNDAYGSLLNKISVSKLYKYGVALGLSQANTIKTGQGYADTTVDDQLILMKELYSYINTGSDDAAELEDYFDNDYYRYIEAGTSDKVLHKYGWMDDVFHDVGIVLDEEPYIVVILTNEGATGNYAKVVTDLSQQIYKLNQLF